MELILVCLHIMELTSIWNTKEKGTNYISEFWNTMVLNIEKGEKSTIYVISKKEAQDTVARINENEFLSLKCVTEEK